MGEMTGKVVLVSGGGRGIGAAIVRTVAERGAAAAVNYHSDEASTNALVADLDWGGSTIRVFQADVGDPDQCARLVAEVVGEFGRLDGGPATRGGRTLRRVGVAHLWRRGSGVPSQRLWSTIPAAAAMINGGRVVLMSSVSARLSICHHAVHAASKAAVAAMVRNLRRSWPMPVSPSMQSPRRNRHRHGRRHGEHYVHPALAALNPARSSSRCRLWAGWRSPRRRRGGGLPVVR
jgi:3-oxoacyl-[acyl-carrier protein] reductase/tetrahydroxynaphthalene reductase